MSSSGRTRGPMQVCESVPPILLFRKNLFLRTHNSSLVGMSVDVLDLAVLVGWTAVRRQLRVPRICVAVGVPALVGRGGVSAGLVLAGQARACRASPLRAAASARRARHGRGGWGGRGGAAPCHAERDGFKPFFHAP